MLGGIAQLARAVALQAIGQGFKSPYLHTYKLLPDLRKQRGYAPRAVRRSRSNVLLHKHVFTHRVIRIEKGRE